MNKIGCEGCTKLKYLESNGTQYIDIGLLSRDARIDISFKYNDSTSNSQILINCLHNTAGWFDLNREGNIVLDSEVFDNNYNTKRNFSIRYNVRYNNSTITATDENNLTKSFSASAVPSTNFTLFSDSAGRFSSKANIYSVKIYNNDNLARDYIPVLDSQKRPCLFDKVEKKCYYNQGTGEFLYG